MLNKLETAVLQLAKFCAGNPIPAVGIGAIRKVDWCPAPQTQPEGTPEPASAAKPVADRATLPYTGAEIEFWSPRTSPAGQEAMRVEFEKLKSLTGIKVQINLADYACVSANRYACEIQPPDFWHGDGTWVPVMAARSQVLELDEYVANWDAWEDFYPRTREDVTYQRQVFGVPISTSHRGSVVIRPSMFEAAGLAPDPPDTWEALNEVTPRLTIADGKVFEQAGFNQTHDTKVNEDRLVQAGGSAFNADLTEPRNNTPEGRSALAQHVSHGLTGGTMPKEGV